MGNCLVTKLKGVVDNPNLRKFGEFFLYTRVVETFNQVSNSVRFAHSEPITVRIVEGSGFLVDSDMSSNPVKSKTLTPVNGWSTIYLTNAAMKLGVSDIANITRIDVSNDISSSSTPKALILDFDEFEYYTGHFTGMYLNYVLVKGDFKNVLCCANNPYLPGEIQCLHGHASQLHGSINSWDGRAIPIGGLSFSDGEVTGDLAQYANATPSVTGITVKGPNVNVHGDMSQLSSESLLYFITQQGYTSEQHFTYTQSNTNRCQLYTEYINFGSGLEQYILDMAAIAQTDRWLNDINLNMIMVTGTIDVTKPAIASAIEVLKAKGLRTFKINGINYNV